MNSRILNPFPRSLCQNCCVLYIHVPPFCRRCEICYCGFGMADIPSLTWTFWNTAQKAKSTGPQEQTLCSLKHPCGVRGANSSSSLSPCSKHKARTWTTSASKNNLNMHKNQPERVKNIWTILGTHFRWILPFSFFFCSYCFTTPACLMLF